MIRRFKRRSVIIEAIEWVDGNLNEVLKFTGDKAHYRTTPEGAKELVIQHRGGLIFAYEGYFVCRNEVGELMSYGREGFLNKYEELK